MKEKLSLLTELIKLARCDKKVRDEEYQFLLTISGTLGVNKEDFDHLFNHYIKYTPPVTEFARILQFHRLVLLMNIDKETSKVEIDHLKNIGIRMGLNPLSTNLVLTEMYNYPDKIIPPDRLIEIFKGQFN